MSKPQLTLLSLNTGKDDKLNQMAFEAGAQRGQKGWEGKKRKKQKTAAFGHDDICRSLPTELSYPILSYPILPYPTLSYPILPYPTLSYPKEQEIRAAPSVLLSQSHFEIVLLSNQTPQQVTERLMGHC